MRDSNGNAKVNEDILGKMARHHRDNQTKKGKRVLRLRFSSTCTENKTNKTHTYMNCKK